MISAHGLGGASDLPIPASLAIAGGTAALTVSFVILLLAWRTPRFGDPRVGRPVPAPLARLIDSGAFDVTVRTAGIVFFAFVVGVAVAGRDLLTNPVFGIVYVWLWVGIVPASLLFGPFFRAVSPARTMYLLLSRLIGGDPDHGLRSYPTGWGYWPAALGLFAFVWLELVWPGATYLDDVRLWFALYLAAVVVGAAVFGSKWLERADPFEVYSTLVGHLSIWARREDGSLVWRSPLRNLAQIRGEPGLVAVVAVLLGSTAYDSFRESNFWLRFTQSTTVNVTLISTGALLTALLIVGLTFSVATLMSGSDQRPAGQIAGRTDGPVSTRFLDTRSALPGAFAHSVVPIVVGYMVAHYLTFFVEYGQQTLIQVSDPLGTGADLFGTGDWQVRYWISSHPTALASIKVLAIVTGHVLGVIAAHDQAIRTLARRDQVIGQLPLLFAMVLYTFGGLYLLFGT